MLRVHYTRFINVVIFHLGGKNDNLHCKEHSFCRIGGDRRVGTMGLCACTANPTNFNSCTGNLDSSIYPYTKAHAYSRGNIHPHCDGNHHGNIYSKCDCHTIT